MDLREIGCEHVNGIVLAEGRVQWWALREDVRIMYRIEDIFHCYSPVTACCEWCLPKLFYCKGEGDMMG
jgi:hypothetical protein